MKILYVWFAAFALLTPILAQKLLCPSGIDGVVTLNATEPLVSVRIGVARAARTGHFETWTDSKGRYSLDLEPGAYSMWAEAKDYGCILIPHVAIHDQERVHEDFNFVRRRIRGSCDVDGRHHDQ